MTKAPLNGSLIHFSCKKDLPIPITPSLEASFIAVYLYSGNITITSQNNIHNIKSGEMICFHDMQEFTETKIFTLSESNIVVVMVH